jgi:GntR family transcriptional regulator of arabinose operon
MPPTAKKRKHAAIFEYLEKAIRTGERREGDRLPSEHELVEIFHTSRPTVARALRELQHAGLIERRAGSGTFVRRGERNGHARKFFGLLITELGYSEIFEPICAQVARRVQALGHSLLWGDSSEHLDGPSAAGDPFQDVAEETGAKSSRKNRAEQACRSYIEQGVAGVFFAPLEFTSDEGKASRDILGALDRAGIPVVLLDRDTVRFPARSRYDVVGIDNVRGAYLMTRHLIELGRKRITFAGRPRSAPTIDRRIAGYREAMWDAGLNPARDWVRHGDLGDPDFVRALLKATRPEAIICANDISAARLMQSLNALGLRVPDDVGVVGFDDVKYAHLLGVPLTTMRQPCRELGTVAVNALLERIAQPDLPPRTILLEPTLVVRSSCGAGGT